MPPNIMKKRRNRDDEASPSRPRKSGKKREPTYETYEEAMDGGVEMEEKGERYRNGDKRFYEKAAELYQKAMQFDETFDATYNLARVQYVLASSFLLPPSALDIYGSSIALYRRALGMTDAPLLQIDACFNIAQACVSLADAMEEIEGERVADGVLELRDAARIFWERAAVGQEGWLRTAAASEAGEAGEAGGQAPEAIPAPAADASHDGDAIAVEGDAAGPSEPSTDTMAVDDGAESDDAAADDNDDTGSGATVYEEHLPTPAALVDTLLSLAQLHMTVTEASSTLTDHDETAGLRSLASQYGSPAHDAEIDISETQLLLSRDRIAWRLYRDTADYSLDSTVGGVAAAAQVLTALYDSLDIAPAPPGAVAPAPAPVDASVRADILTMLAESHMTYAHRLMFVVRRAPGFAPGPSPEGQRAWAQCASAVDALTRALALPTATLPPLFKASTTLLLSQASLARARLADVNAAAASNLPTLLDNAAAYAKQAAAALGWATEPAGVRLGYPAGWDAESLGRNIVLQAARASYYGAKLGGREDAGRALVESIKGDGPRALGKRDLERWLEDVEDDEGPVDEAERAHWASMFDEPESA